MILTRKCKEDFENWFRTKRATPAFRWWMLLSMDSTLVNALIIEFFDSVGIYVSVYICHDNTFDFSINNITYNSFTKTRQKATTEAIKKANEIYNNR